jgi:hypothetical protein
MLLKKRELINWYCEKNDWSTDDFKEQCGRYEDHEDFPCEREGLFGCFARTPLDVDAIQAELESVQ